MKQFPLAVRQNVVKGLFLCNARYKFHYGFW